MLSKLIIMASKKLLTYDQWDYKDVVKNIELSTVYIVSLQNIITDMIHKDQKLDTVGETFAKFDKITEQHRNGTNPMEGVTLDNWEKQVYTLFSLLQTIKVGAYDQKLNKPTKTTATQADLREATALMMDGSEEAEAKLKEIQSKITLA